MSNEELLNAFADYLDAALNMDLDAQIKEISNVPNDGRGPDRRAALRCHRNALQAHKLWHSPDVPRGKDEKDRKDRTKQKALAVVKSYAATHVLQDMTRKDYCSSSPERSFERAALGAFFGFLQILQATR